VKANSLYTDWLLANGTRYNVSASFKMNTVDIYIRCSIVNEKTKKTFFGDFLEGS